MRSLTSGSMRASTIPSRSTGSSSIVLRRVGALEHGASPGAGPSGGRSRRPSQVVAGNHSHLPPAVQRPIDSLTCSLGRSSADNPSNSNRVRPVAVDRGRSSASPTRRVATGDDAGPRTVIAASAHQLPHLEAQGNNRQTRPSRHLVSTTTDAVVASGRTGTMDVRVFGAVALRVDARPARQRVDSRVEGRRARPIGPPAAPPSPWNIARPHARAWSRRRPRRDRRTRCDPRGRIRNPRSPRSPGGSRPRPRSARCV
jgi:hypothetical protein